MSKYSESERPGLGLKAGDPHYRAYVGPPKNYDVLSAIQFCLLARLGLRDYHSLLDIGCGSLRAGRLLIPYLLPDQYCGLEPEEWLIEQGIANELGRDLIDIKKPAFAHNREFDFSPFNKKFNFMLAQSVLTHAGRSQIVQFFASVAAYLQDGGILAVTYLRGTEDHQGESWVYPGITRYTPAFMERAAGLAGLGIIELDWPHPGITSPVWLAVGHPGLAARLPSDLIK